MSNPPRGLPPKKEVALSLLEGTSIYVHLDPRRDGVMVPKNFQKQPQLVLQVGLQMAVNIPDLNVDEEALTCTLSFNRTPFWCCLPWSAVYALVGEDGRGMVWPEDVPPEVATQMQQKAVGTKPARKRPRLAAVAKPAEPSESDESDEAKESAARAEPGTLRGDAVDGPDDDYVSAEVSEEASSEEAAEVSEKKPSKRPSLAAVPNPAPDEKVDAGATDADAAKADEQAKAEDEPSGAKPDEPATGGKKKRELPPYLRIVK